MDKPYEAPQGRLLPTLVIFLFVLSLLYGLFLFFQQMSLNRSTKALEQDKVRVQAKIDEMKSEQIEELFVAQELREKIEDRSIEWSKVVRSLQDLTPVAVFLSAYTMNEDGSIQVSGLGDSYGSVADIISSLQKSSSFDGVFVPSVTAGTTSEGQNVVSFNLKLIYQNQ